MSFRKEKKFRLTSYEALLLRAQLFKLGMEELFPPREINSQYFDTHDLRMFRESEEGLVPRKKVRVRWYNSDFNYTLEKKISSIEGRFKKTSTIGHKEYELLSNNGIFDKKYGLIKPSLLVSYKREYYAHKKLRITFDTDIKYTVYRNNTYSDFEVVVEIKAPFNTPDDFIESLIPFSSARFSKYARGFLLSDKFLA